MAIEFAGADTSDSSLTALTSGGTIGTKGSYVELIASTARESYVLTVTVTASETLANNKENFHIFLATGAAASEVDFLDFCFWASGVGVEPVSFSIPFTIAASARVSACCAATDGSHEVEIAIALSDDDAYGTSTQNTTVGVTGANDGNQGTDVDPGGTANTKGSWTEIASSAPHDFDQLVVCVGMSNNNNLTAARWLVDIGTGAAASESVLVGDMAHAASAFENGNTFYSVLAPVSSGTRIAARAQCSITDATDRVIDVSIVGVNITAPSGGGGGGGGGAYAFFG